jgi:SAM-dependent methyltransferase
MRSLEDVQALIRQRSMLPPEEREAIVDKRFGALPRRLTRACRYWPLDLTRVLDVGCSYGHCLVHFGGGSIGLDNVPEHVDFCRSLGLDAQLCDVEEGLDRIPDSAFDFVWVSDIVEHLDAPRLLLRRLAPKLNQGGRVVMLVSVLPSWRLARPLLRGHGWFDADVHNYQFTVDTARHLVEHSGYAVERVVVHLLPDRLDPVAGLLAPVAPVIFISARPDERAEMRARAAERRNRPTVDAAAA